MNRVRCTLLSLILLAAGCRTTPPDVASSDESIWAGRAAQIKVGMRREEVEQILRQSQETIGFGPMTVLTGGMQAVNYRVSPNWVIVVAYDYTGVRPEPVGEVLQTASPDNRVLLPPAMHRATGKIPNLPVVAQTLPDHATLLARVDRIQVGMRREDVERILDFRYMDGSYASAVTRTGSSQGVVYRVTPGYLVVVIYDYTGGSNHPDNRVLLPARLEPAAGPPPSATNKVLPTQPVDPAK